MEFARIRGALLEPLYRRVAACDHLDRAAESILVNIAHASTEKGRELLRRIAAMLTSLSRAAEV